MNDKTLDVTNVQEAKTKINDIKVFGDGDTFALLCKASSESQGWMKSTKVCNVEDGCIVQVSTQQRNPDGSYAVAEALTYVPRVQIDKDAEPRRLVPIQYPTLGSTLGRSYIESDEDRERREKEQNEYRYKEYLSILLQLQQSGHECHEEINQTLTKLRGYMF